MNYDAILNRDFLTETEIIFFTLEDFIYSLFEFTA